MKSTSKMNIKAMKLIITLLIGSLLSTGCANSGNLRSSDRFRQPSRIPLSTRNPDSC